MTRVLLLLLLLSLSTCSAIQQSLQDQADPRHHPFDSYGNGGGGSH
jgi:hypothetical protein